MSDSITIKKNIHVSCKCNRVKNQYSYGIFLTRTLRLQILKKILMSCSYNISVLLSQNRTTRKKKVFFLLPTLCKHSELMKLSSTNIRSNKNYFDTIFTSKKQKERRRSIPQICDSTGLPRRPGRATWRRVGGTNFLLQFHESVWVRVSFLRGDPGCVWLLKN